MFSMFSSKKEAPKPAVTVEETEKFLKELMLLITEAKGIDPAFPLKGKGKETNEENMRAIANGIKSSLDQNLKRLGHEAAVSVTDTNKQSLPSYIANSAFKDGISLTSLGLFFMTIYRCHKTAPSDEIKNEFLHHCAAYLHQVTKEWVTKNGGWVDAFVDAADEQAMINFIGLSRKQIASIETAAKVCAAGVGLFAVTKMIQYCAFSNSTPRPM